MSALNFSFFKNTQLFKALSLESQAALMKAVGEGKCTTLPLTDVQAFRKGDISEAEFIARVLAESATITLK